jgi:dimethylargininase
MLTAITREPARSLEACELTYLKRQAIDAERLAAQHAAYRAALEDCGARVLLLPAVDELPDSVFVEDTAVVLDELAVVASPGVASRRAEAGIMEPELARLRPVARVRPPATLEGGDVLRVGRRLFAGLSCRTNRAGVESLRELCAPHGYEVVPVEVRGCLHLKTACTAVDGETILLNPAWVDAADFAGYETLAAHPEEPWAANTLRLGQTLLVSAAHPRTAERLSRLVPEVRPLDLSEFVKAEGSLTCMSLIVESSQ